MSQFFISCKESRIENNRSFYGCFYLGPFEPSQSITIANALRRTLLSELYGIGIVSVEIEGASHEYSSLPGVRDSVLDILLNLKEIVLKKTIKNFKPQIGYLRVRGPGVVRASHLRLPPFIQCVDPNQYIATLADNGFLNMKFIIQYGNKWLSPINSLSTNYNQRTDNKEKEETKNLCYPPSGDSAFNTHLKKRRLILKKLKQMGIASSNSYINMFSQSAIALRAKFTKKRNINRRGLNLVVTINKKYPGINLKNSPTVKKLSKSIEKEISSERANTTKGFDHARWVRASATFKKYNLGRAGKGKTNSSASLPLLGETFKKKMVFFNANPLSIDAIFNPIKKVNYIIEINDFKTAPSKMQTSFETSELYEMLKSSNLLSSTAVEKDLKNSIQSQFRAGKQIKASLSEVGKQEIDNILEMKREINALKKETTKHNITLEVWTNGSIHPRDALYQGFKNLIKLFAKLKKINIVGVNNFFLNPGSDKQTDHIKVLASAKTFNLSSKDKFKTPPIPNKNKEISLDVQTNLLLKKSKMAHKVQSTLLQDLLPLNETSFLSTYVAPKLKNYYLNNESLPVILKSPVLKRKNEPVSISNATELITENNLQSNKKNLLSNLDIGILNLSLRSYTSLKRLKINTIEELLEFYNNYLSNNISEESTKKKLGKASVEEIEKSLEKIGLNLK
jgi:DNA-directed RNA polymerase alpha subunit